jgi:type II secretory pathway pseudopilin PulG
MRTLATFPEKEDAVSKSQTDTRQAGFSLVELLVAMAVTMVIGGTIMGLMMGGANTFKREPDRSDRQQNIRSSMDLIMRDIGSAGEAMPDFLQTFTPGYNACSGCPNGGSPAGVDPAGGGQPDGGVADELEIFSNNANFDPEPTCHYPGGSSSVVRMTAGSSKVQVGMVVMITMSDGSWTMRYIDNISFDNTAAGSCINTGGGAKSHIQLSFNNGSDPTGMYNVPGGLCAAGSIGTSAGGSCQTADVVLAEVIHWRVRPGPDGVPNLERSSSNDPAGGFKVVARGIEDMQVEYATAADASNVWRNGAPLVVNNNYGSVITRVRVSLAARGEVTRVQGQGATNANAGATQYMRSRLTSTGSPRAALIAAAKQNPTGLWN